METNDTTHGTISSSAATGGSRWFLDPDGDLLLRKPVVWIRVVEGRSFFRRRYYALLKFEGDDGWSWRWTLKTLDEAKRYRDALIATLCENADSLNKQKLAQPTPQTVEAGV